ncbi:GNAT family N-acetyltransferase [Laceyella putida]|uniref:GNAT family N-acetyltransferase n=1 Tax=Laceyella putida TaxID=110101 RepID=A0ABW2RQ77_9BACL
MRYSLNFQCPTLFFIFSRTPRTHLIGKINLSFNRQTGHIYGFCVNPAHQGQGIGTAIIAAALGRYQSQVETFTLEVATENPLAIRLYERCGGFAR